MVNTFNIDSYRDLKNITVDKTQALDKRLKQYIIDVKNPYLVRVGDMLVKIEFGGNNSFFDSLSVALG